MGRPPLSRLRRRFAPLRGTQRRCAALRAAPPGRYAPRALRAQAFCKHEKNAKLSNFLRPSRYPWICPWAELCRRVPRPSLATRPQALLIVVNEVVGTQHAKHAHGSASQRFCGAGYELRAKESSG